MTDEEEDTEEVIMLSDSENSICINLSTECRNSIYDLGFGSIAKFYLRKKTEQVLHGETEYQWVKPELRIGKQVGWISLSGIPGRKLLESFDQSYKGFKTRFFKIWAVRGEPYFLLNSEDGKPLFPLYWSHDPQPIKEVDETRLPRREFCIVQFLKMLPMLSTVKILAAQNDPNAMDAYLCSMAPKMSKKKMEELLESTKKEGTSHVTANVVKDFCNKNIPEAIPLPTVSVAFAPTSKAPTNPTLWAKHLREFNEGPEDSLWNLSIDRSEIVDEHIVRRADEAKFARAGDIGICKALTSHNLRSIAMVRHLEYAIIKKDVSIETLKNKVDNLEKELAAEKENLATAYSKLKKEKNDLAAKYKAESHGWTQLKKKLEDDVADYQRGFAEQYRDGFENAISQIRIIAPNVDVSKVDKYKVVRDGSCVERPSKGAKTALEVCCTNKNSGLRSENAAEENCNGGYFKIDSSADHFIRFGGIFKVVFEGINQDVLRLA
ncbi:hypothetical protein TSUD_365520 [Trifolium subterraneum]|uniref:Uncharacterized protein n=1 Tax=Trifolium subterraneum TaxID=3900 RepID=A0A2Z6MDT5_TRISU|nr:hypothetical protein TSUD_365520 [Trifolium subterraneum]